MNTNFSLRELDPILKEVINQSPLDIGIVSGEILLLFAVLDRAIKDTLDPHPQIRNSAIVWLLNDPPTRLRLNLVCDLLGLDLSLLKRLLEERIQKTTPQLAA